MIDRLRTVQWKSTRFVLTSDHTSISATGESDLRPSPCVALIDTTHGLPARFRSSSGATDLRQQISLGDSELETFLKTFHRQNISAPPRWLSNPFSYSRRKRDFEFASCNPTFFIPSDSQLKAFDAFAKCSQKIGRQGRSYFDKTLYEVYGYESRKGNSGFQRGLTMVNISVREEYLPGTLSNLKPVALVNGSDGIWFFPNFFEIHVDETTNASSELRLNVEAATYNHLRVEMSEQLLVTDTYVEGEEVVDYTWTYVNKDGRPDRRYSNNPQRVIIRVWELDLLTDSARIDMQFTSRDLAISLADSVRALIQSQEN